MKRATHYLRVHLSGTMCSISAFTVPLYQPRHRCFLPHQHVSAHGAHTVAQHGSQRLYCVISISDSANESSVLKKNGTVVGADCPTRAQSVCSSRCGMKSQQKPKECELSFCRLPAAAALHRPFYCTAAAASQNLLTTTRQKKRENKQELLSKE